jgi:hypothetical protein
VKSIITVAIIVGLGALVVVIAGSFLQNNTGFMGMGDAKPWFGLSCGEMLDFSGSDNHHMMHDSMQIGRASCRERV